MEMSVFCSAAEEGWSAVKANRVVIKKYPNRRLYDTSAGRYVNLEDVAALVRDGTDIQVVDAKTGEDLTRLVLTQVIMEDAKGQPAGLPLELLRQLIVASDHASQEFLTWYLKSAFDAYGKVQESMESRLNDVRAAAMTPLNLVKNLFTPAAETSEVEMLRKRVAELEAQVGTKGRKKAGKKRT